MSELYFFDPKGNPMKKNQFIQFYSQCYYLKNSAVVEEDIEKLQKEGIKAPSDVMKILEWKIGGIDNKQSQASGNVCYSHPQEVGRYQTKTRSGIIDAEQICEYIAKHYSELTTKEPCEIFQILRDFQTENLGTVYLLTLVYFISKGEMPIYDRFAQQALDAICAKKKPGEYVKQKTPPDKMSKTAFQWYEKNYRTPLKNLFPQDYKNRDLDRALWVYGHLFNDNKKNHDRVAKTT